MKVFRRGKCIVCNLPLFSETPPRRLSRRWNACSDHENSVRLLKILCRPGGSELSFKILGERLAMKATSARRMTAVLREAGLVEKGSTTPTEKGRSAFLVFHVEG